MIALLIDARLTSNSLCNRCIPIISSMGEMTIATSPVRVGRILDGNSNATEYTFDRVTVLGITKLPT